MNKLAIAYFVVSALDVTSVTSVSVTPVEHADPCLASTLRNISHINERYARLEDNCFYSDHKIETTWFYAGEDPIVTFPPVLCRCGYKFPIWMNGTLPSSDVGVVNRTACIRFTEPCYRKLNIKIKNCGTFYIYHLTPSGLDDSGYCFGIEKPESHKTPDEHNLPIATVTIQQNATTDNSVISTFNITSINDDYNATAELVRSDGLVIQTIVLSKTLMVYKWDNLSAATNYTIRVYIFNNGLKKEIASVWAVTKTPYRPARAHINVLQNTITNSSFSTVITFDFGSENKAGEGKVVQQDGVVIQTFPVESSSFSQSFQGLSFGTKYTIEVNINRHEESIQLAQESVFTKPEIEAFLESKLAVEMVRSFTVFKCNFNPSPETTYGVSWFVQSREKNYTLEKTVEVGEGIQRLYATEKDLVNNHIALPFHISCKVFEIPKVIKAEFSPSSTNLFAGIKILTPVITMHRDETAIILISPTIPFGCTSLQKTGISSCNLTLAISIPVSQNCTGLATRKCTITVPGSAGSKGVLQIQATEDGQYGLQKDATHKVILRTIRMLNDSIWKDYTLSAATVIVKPETNTYWRGKRCEALNDPHMYTFDGKRYEHHEHLSDEYVMYTHESYTAKIHHKLERCNKNAMCNCGVAVQAGRDIYLISTCNNIMEIGYKQCDDGVLLVKKENDYTYTIYFPFGTYVTARLDKTPYSNSVGSMIVSVSVYPSVHDQYGRTKGLCGTLDGKQTNDFHDRAGQTVLNETEFILAWKVPIEESLFGDNTKSTSHWLHPACSCTVSNGHVTTNDKCRLGADNSCAKGQTVGEQTCKLAEKISLDSFKTHNVPVLDLGKHMTTKGPSVTTITANNNAVSPKTQIPTPTTPVYWNAVEATSFCTNFLNRSRAFRLCTRVPYTDTDRAIETCTQDILITHTTEWHKLSRQSMQDACLSEIHRNKTVREHLEPPKKATPSPTQPGGQHNGHVTTLKPTDPIIDSNLNINELIDVIKEITCPNECSDKGNCNNGVCKCSPRYGGDDCSIDFKQAPSTASFLHGSICDEREAPCAYVFIHGGLFAGETVSCHITTFETHADKKGRQNLDAYVVRGQAQSLIEVICPLATPIRRKKICSQYSRCKATVVLRSGR